MTFDWCWRATRSADFRCRRSRICYTSRVIVPVPGRVFLALLAVICALLDGAPVAAATHTSVMVGVHGTMHAELYVPDGPGPFPGVLLLHTSGGLQPADLDTAQELADEGYVCLVPAFMAAYHLTYESRRDTFDRYGDAVFADLIQALGTLKSDPHVQGGNVGAIGFSNGGYFAVWLALTGHVQAAVSYYGAYTAGGSDVDEKRYRSLVGPAAAPILILHGEDDTTVPVAAARRLAAMLAGAGAPYQLQIYPATGHSFDRGEIAVKLGTKSVNARSLRGASTGDDAAAADAWAQTLAYFRTYLQR